MRAIDAKHFWLQARFERRAGWDDDVYPFNLAAVRWTDTLTFHPKVTFLVGENGAGKSTLVEALAVAWGFNPEGGSTGMQFQTRGSHSQLHRFIRCVRGAARAKDGYFLRAESFYNAASYIEDTGVSGYGERALHGQSHGESFFTLFEQRFRGRGLYILDEPEAALSPNRQLSFLVRMHELIQGGSQFIIASHSPIILGYPNAQILRISAHGLEPTAYEDTEHFQVTRAFLNRPSEMLKTLLS